MTDEVEGFLKDFFEVNGFLVGRAVMDALPPKGGRMCPCLRVRNLRDSGRLGGGVDNPSFQRFSGDVARMASAVVAVAGFELVVGGKTVNANDRKYVQAFMKSLSAKPGFVFPWEIDGAGEPASAKAEEHLLVIPMLPSAEPSRGDVIDALSRRGVTGVFTMRTILDHLIQRVEQIPPEQLSAGLRILSLLRQMDLVKGSQLDLFGG